MKITLLGLVCGIAINAFLAQIFVFGKDPTKTSMELGLFSFKTIMVLVTIGIVLFPWKKPEDK